MTSTLIEFIRSHDSVRDVRQMPSGELRVATDATQFTPDEWVNNYANPTPGRPFTAIDVIPPTLSAARNLLGY